MEQCSEVAITEMYEPCGESDDDCEIYFLKPVNEYNIVDKIKEANKKLFADASGKSDITDELTVDISAPTATLRKVTFAKNLEDFAPESIEQDAADGFQEDEGEAETRSPIRTEIEKFPTIDEEEVIGGDGISEEMADVAEDEINDENEGTSMISLSDSPAQAPPPPPPPIESDDVDDICEEIIVMAMDINSTAMKALNKVNSIKSSRQRQHIVKQRTFDCDDADNKSLMNLLTESDCEEDIIDDEPENCNAMDNDEDIFMGIDNCNESENEDDDDDDDDDDRLSLIVASYLPDDYERVLPSPSPPKDCNSGSAGQKNENKKRSYFQRNSDRNNSSNKGASSTTSFSRYFQLRRKSHSTNSIGTLCTDNYNSNAHNFPGDLKDLKLNYKTCCEYRNRIQGKLPKYTGYLSEYGLSQEQLQQREMKMQKKQRFVLEQALDANEKDMQKMRDNERAFTTWLRNKMRFPINKTRNMFDVKFGRFSKQAKANATSATGGAGGGRETTMSAEKNHRSTLSATKTEKT